jgi:hypothetical protein
MHLRSALGISPDEEIDPTRPITVGPHEFGVEAANEARRILDGGEFSDEVSLQPHSFGRPTYWAVDHSVEGSGEIFGFPTEDGDIWPTALEVGIIRALAATAPEHHQAILTGSHCVSIGPARALAAFLRVVLVVEVPLVGASLLAGLPRQANIAPRLESDMSQVVLDCLENSFKTSPLKFRFLELYRMMEARFLADVKSKLFAQFDGKPSTALADAVEALKSEMNQIAGLAADHPQPFEACWTTLAAIKNSNRFVAALFRTIDKKGHNGGGKSKAGAALIYQIRCAIVHAGEKDMIFEQYPDGEEALEAIISDVERAALLLVGIELT